MRITTNLATFAFVKILDKYILKSFLVPFFATFFIILFVLVMQALWLAFDDIAGKGIDLIFILKFLWFTALMVIPQALPIGILLSSIMTLGSLSENYEFAAAKSAGISLRRLVRSLVFFALFSSVLNFLFLNYVYPYSNLKLINLRVNIKKKLPAMALIPGSFNSEIPNYQIKFDERYGENNNFLKNVLIYDLSEKRGNKKIITAKSGEIISEDGSRYLTLILKDGHYFENHIQNNTPYKKRKRMPASYADFDEYKINIDVSALSGDDLDDIKFTKNYNMLSLKQLKDTIPIMKENYDGFVNNRAKILYTSSQAKELHVYDTVPNYKKLNSNIVDNFKAYEQALVLNNAVTKSKQLLNDIKSNKENLKFKRKILNHYDIEFYNRVAFSLSCLILFFIGAPLGSIIRKGGMGLPMILAIAIYILYFFSNTFGRNLAEESSLTAFFGSWLSAILMVPIATLLTVRATQDKSIFDINSFLSPITLFIKKIFLKTEKNT
ncbi:LptF/LptG family permease [Tenacibaculum sp. UWU-22]|uniref:LptF/LptG family permease n=1 Tax=Tenacibaculum sp. UWU-22 TaxID=3234187 RepID=UPI0034DAE689